MKKFLSTLIYSSVFALFATTAFATDYSKTMTLKDIKVRAGTPNCVPSADFVSSFSYKTKSDGKASFKFSGHEERIWGLRAKNGITRARFKKDESGYTLRFKARKDNVLQYKITERKLRMNEGELHSCGFKYEVTA